MLPGSGWLRFGYLRVKPPESRQATLAVLRQAFELAGVEFTPMVISLASASPRPLQRTPRSLPVRLMAQLPRK